ncbi:MAG: glycoside hydrolase family 95 protein [Prevotellaceae bacterium]|jgi:alpha-L-fucosidase 2|nr:glycoside hydrolase family 95 protein [Prevotellaceae bacterium]
MKHFLFTAAIFAATLSSKAQSELSLWFDRPARQWEETLPLGNGRLGMTPDGGIVSETIVLNDITLWSGGVQEADNPEALKHLDRIRQLLYEGRNDEAQELMYTTFVCKGPGSSGQAFGRFEILGNLRIDYKYPSQSAVEDYRRKLSIDEATALTSFRIGNTEYTREYFAAFGYDVLVVKLKSSGSEALNFVIGLDRPQAFETSVEGESLLMRGQLDNGSDGKGMKYATRVSVKQAGGKVVGKNQRLEISGAKEAIIFISSTTDYLYPKFDDRCLSLLRAALGASYAAIKSSHIKAYKKYFDRMSLHLEPRAAGRDSLPTDRRLQAFAADHADNGLVELYFQFGRYLFISSARAGVLPPNLQGLWTNTINTPWNGDYHLNINAQMNHWPVETTNLAELAQPLIQLTASLVNPGSRTAKTFYKANGWVAHMMTNPWGFTSPGEHPSWGATNTGGAWLCAHLWDHYDFGRSRRYLEEIYPVLKGAAVFFLDILVTEPKNGWLVTAPTSSPENSFRMPGSGKSASVCMGSTMDNQLIRELFGNVASASEILNIDADLRKKLREAAGKLPPNRIGSDGRLMEWLEEYEETDPHHRHVSHLYGLYPGNQIVEPHLLEAARKTLEVRGDGGTGWSRAWKINFWARLGDGNRAFKLLCNLLNPTTNSGMDYSDGGGTYPNLFCAHPPFQIDGNFGGCSGIAEMFVQSYSGAIEFLPALPTVISKGSFSGMRVRGGGEVSASWEGGKLVSASLRASVDNVFRIKIPRMTRFTKSGKTIHPTIVDETAEIPLKAGEEIIMNYEFIIHNS